MQRPLLMERRRVFSAFGSTVRLSIFLWIRWCRWRVLHQQGHFLALWIKLPDLPREGEEGNGVFLLWSWVSVLSWRPLWSQWRFSWSHMLCMPVLVAFCCVCWMKTNTQWDLNTKSTESRFPSRQLGYGLWFWAQGLALFSQFFSNRDLEASHGPVEHHSHEQWLFVFRTDGESWGGELLSWLHDSVLFVRESDYLAIS